MTLKIGITPMETTTVFTNISGVNAIMLNRNGSTIANGSSPKTRISLLSNTIDGFKS